MQEWPSFSSSHCYPRALLHVVSPAEYPDFLHGGSELSEVQKLPGLVSVRPRNNTFCWLKCSRGQLSFKGWRNKLHLLRKIGEKSDKEFVTFLNLSPQQCFRW